MIRDSELRKRVWDTYGDLLKESGHEIVDDGGIVRWKASPLGRWLGDHVDLNAMARDFHRGCFPLKEYKQFYREMGYSLCGFAEIFGNLG